jgi:hypothetical protein
MLRRSRIRGGHWVRVNWGLAPSMGSAGEEQIPSGWYQVKGVETSPSWDSCKNCVAGQQDIGQEPVCTGNIALWGVEEKRSCLVISSKRWFISLIDKVKEAPPMDDDVTDEFPLHVEPRVPGIDPSWNEDIDLARTLKRRKREAVI